MDLLKGDLNPNIDAKGGGDITIVAGNALEGEVGPLGTLPHIEERNREISIYTVREGDTLSAVASMFDVSVNTIMWANDIKNGKIKEGDTLVILPVSGITYTVKSGDTVASIAKKYNANEDEIVMFNDLTESESLTSGQVITIPDAEVAPVIAAVPATKVGKAIPPSSGSSYFTRPVKGIKTQGIHGYNGVDIGAPIGTPIWAAASGVVIVSKFDGGWNGGYGNYVVIKHGNGMQTLYAHMSFVAAKVGQTVSQGEVIGKVGTTGKSTGPHLHFEVRGGKNPF